MAERAVGDLSAGRLAAAVVPAIVAGFDKYQAAFMGITRRAKGRFERCDWRGAVADAAERLDLYGHVIDRLESEVRSDLGERVAACSKSRFAQEPGLWAPARVEGDPVRRATQAPPPAWCPA